ncbi:IMPACT family protein [Zongyangia hominis]|uniref:YigZ family protein n=1 Tax=Zongyangia hominis TaxID=2763677 RepID=A0A926IAN2_9FIRM|nr:YigZ family protein [Zongyangia hominis]MBC8569388.1 YigZ family protein [Zongyangia hominis]
MKDYITLKKRDQDEFVERRSRFIGTATPVQTEEEALAFISELRSKYWDASHNVYAYILRDGTVRYCDDGEPQGTAGVPVLDVLQKEGLTDLCVVVTRYFGGILLGGGGLVRAYSHGAKIAIDAAGRKPMSVCKIYDLEMDYSMYGKVSYLLPQFHAVTLSSDFGVAVKMRVEMKAVHAERFVRELEEATSATVFPYEVEEICDCLEEK